MYNLSQNELSYTLETENPTSPQPEQKSVKDQPGLVLLSAALK